MELNQPSSSNPSYQRNRYEQRRQAGVCTRCGGKRGEGSSVTLCRECREGTRQRSSKSIKKSVFNGICSTCRQEKEIRIGFSCDECRLELHIGKRHKGLLIKEEVMSHYGGPVCVCCGEDCLGFLTMDHKNNDGPQHRKRFLNGENIYTFLKRNNFPTDVELQIMCYNCNFGRERNGGICPHLGYSLVSSREFRDMEVPNGGLED